MDEVARTHQPVIVSKRGKPTVRIMPIAGDEEIALARQTRLVTKDDALRALPWLETVW
jgi:antitoxin (DNA-binding transcriptional repressor) of toxin-antitoxin stability system